MILASELTRAAQAFNRELGTVNHSEARAMVEALNLDGEAHTQAQDIVDDTFTGMLDGTRVFTYGISNRFDVSARRAQKKGLLSLK